jgi:hypothetical protein
MFRFLSGDDPTRIAVETDAGCAFTAGEEIGVICTIDAERDR